MAIVIIAVFVVGFISGPLGMKIFGDQGLPFGLSQPEIHLPASVIFHLFGFPITNSVIGAWITMAFLVISSFLITRRLKIVPGRLQSAFEFAIVSLFDFCRNVAGERRARQFFPIVTTIFLFVMFNSWISLLPGFGSIEVGEHGHAIHLLRGANTDINVPIALALASFLAVWYMGFKALGIGYLKGFFNVGKFLGGFGKLFTGKVKGGLGGILLGILDIFVGLIELLSVFIRLLSFTFRLFGNMTAGEILLLMMAFLIPYLVAIPFYGLELLVGFVQALIFGGLTLVFLTMATTSHDSH
ncbi:F0F1 ATP synthase subunit A [Chloroflexota bacterium]